MSLPLEDTYGSPTRFLLFDKLALLASGLFIFLAVFYGESLFVFLLAILLVMAGAAKLWSRYSLWRVTYDREISETHVFPGESVQLRLRLTNRKFLPVAFLEVGDEIPLKLSPLKAALVAPEGSPVGYLRHLVSLLWYRRVNWQYQLLCQSRGYYKLGPVHLNSGDIFGFFPCSTTLSQCHYLTVYPRILSLEKFTLPKGEPVGETKAPRFIFEDPSRTVGVRDYRRGDPIKHIHWKATARRQELQVRIYEPTSTLQLVLILDAASFVSPALERRDDFFELAITAVASIAYYASEKRYRVGLLVNSQEPIRMFPASHRQQLTNMLEALAKLTLSTGSRLEGFLQGQRGNLPWGTTLILVTGSITDTVIAMLHGLRQSGYQVVPIYVGVESPRLRRLGIKVCHVMNDATLTSALAG